MFPKYPNSVLNQERVWCAPCASSCCGTSSFRPNFCSLHHTTFQKRVSLRSVAIDDLRTEHTSDKVGCVDGPSARPTCCDDVEKKQLTSDDFSHIPEALLKELRAEGIRMKHVTKIGRRGACDYVVNDIATQFRARRLVKLKAHGRPSANMKLLVHELERKTGAVAIHRAGCVVVLYKEQTGHARPIPRGDKVAAKVYADSPDKEQQDDVQPSIATSCA